MRRLFLLFILSVSVSACSCKEWGYCPHVFPNAERFVQGEPDTCLPVS